MTTREAVVTSIVRSSQNPFTMINGPDESSLATRGASHSPLSDMMHIDGGADHPDPSLTPSTMNANAADHHHRDGSMVPLMMMMMTRMMIEGPVNPNQSLATMVSPIDPNQSLPTMVSIDFGHDPEEERVLTRTVLRVDGGDRRIGGDPTAQHFGPDHPLAPPPTPTQNTGTPNGASDWLEEYLAGLAGTLRRGGWHDNDIIDMLGLL